MKPSDYWFIAGVMTILVGFWLLSPGLFLIGLGSLYVVRAAMCLKKEEES